MVGVFKDFNDLRDDVATALNFDPVANEQAEAFDEIGVVQRSAADRSASDEDGCEDVYKRQDVTCKSISCLVLFSLLLCVACIAQAPTTAQPNKPETRTSCPSDPKAKKTFDEAVLLMKDSRYVFALEGFRKADKQDGGHCIVCEQKAWDAAVAPWGLQSGARADECDAS